MKKVKNIEKIELNYTIININRLYFWAVNGKIK